MSPPAGLRQDYASTSASALAGRRSQSYSFQLSRLCAGPGLEEEDEEDDEDYALLPPPQPRLTRLSHSHTFCSVRDWRRSTSSLFTPPSTPSTPPHPSVGSAYPASPPPPLGPGDPYGIEAPGFNPGSGELTAPVHSYPSSFSLLFLFSSFVSVFQPLPLFSQSFLPPLFNPESVNSSRTSVFSLICGKTSPSVCCLICFLFRSASSTSGSVKLV